MAVLYKLNLKEMINCACAEDWYELRDKYLKAEIVEVEGGYTLDFLLPLVDNTKPYPFSCIMKSKEECEKFREEALKGPHINY